MCRRGVIVEDVDSESGHRRRGWGDWTQQYVGNGGAVAGLNEIDF